MPARAKLPRGEGKRVPLNMRTTQEVRGRLEKSAADSGRSLVQEVEYRIERSYLAEDHLSIIFDDSRTAGFVREILDAKRLIESHQGKSVWEDFESHEAMKAALKRLLAQKAPRPTGKYKKRLASYERYVERVLKPWRERGGGQGLFGNPDAGPQPPLKPSPVKHARALGRAAADVVTQNRVKALIEVLKAGTPEED